MIPPNPALENGGESMETNTVPQRPAKVKLAVNLLYLGLVIGAVIGAIEAFLDWPSVVPVGQEQTPVTVGIVPMLLIALPIFGLFFWLYCMIGKGRNWARMIFLVLGVIGAIYGISIILALNFTEIPLWILDPPRPSSISDTILQVLQNGIYIAALILLFQQDSSAWFKAMKAWRKPPEVAQKWQPPALEPDEALIEATRKGDMKQVKHFLSEGADINARNKWGLTPLMAAAHGGHIEISKLLLEKGAEVNARQNGGWTALMVAAVKGHVDVMNLLLGKGAEVNARTDGHMTALTLARTNGQNQVAQFLISKGATV